MEGQWARALFLAKGSLKSPSSLVTLWALLLKGLVPRDETSVHTQLPIGGSAVLWPEVLALGSLP